MGVELVLTRLTTVQSAITAQTSTAVLRPQRQQCAHVAVPTSTISTRPIAHHSTRCDADGLTTKTSYSIHIRTPVTLALADERVYPNASSSIRRPLLDQFESRNQYFYTEDGSRTRVSD